MTSATAEIHLTRPERLLLGALLNVQETLHRYVVAHIG